MLHEVIEALVALVVEFHELSLEELLCTTELVGVLEETETELLSTIELLEEIGTELLEVLEGT